jgi:hypothetical protein
LYRTYNKYGAQRNIACTHKMPCYTHKETLIFLSVKNGFLIFFTKIYHK